MKTEWGYILWTTLKTLDDFARLLGFVAMGYLLAHFVHFLLAP